MAIEIVDFPIKNGYFPWQNVSSPEGIVFRSLNGHFATWWSLHFVWLKNANMKRVSDTLRHRSDFSGRSSFSEKTSFFFLLGKHDR